MHNTEIKHLGKQRTEVIQIRGQVSYSQNVCFHKKNLSEYSHSNCFCVDGAGQFQQSQRAQSPTVHWTGEQYTHCWSR